MSKLITYGTGSPTVEDLPKDQGLVDRLRSLSAEARAFVANGRGAVVARLSVDTDGVIKHVLPTVADLLALHNAVAEVAVTRFINRDAAVKATAKAVGAFLRRGAAPAAATAKRSGGKPPTHADDALVRLKVDVNPKRAGGQNRERFEAMMRTIRAKGGAATVAEVLEAGATRGDLRYDVAHNFIEVVQGVRPRTQRHAA